MVRRTRSPHCGGRRIAYTNRRRFFERCMGGKRRRPRSSCARGPWSLPTVPMWRDSPSTPIAKEMTMKAAVVRDFHKPLHIEERPTPTPGVGQVLVKIETSGLCHTDIHAAHGDWPVKPHLPFIPGHEGVGIVEQVGPGVTVVKEGDRVAIPWLGYACGTCEYCISGWETLCEQQLNT